MDIAPLALVVLLGYGLLIAISLTTWTAVAYFREDAEEAGKQLEPAAAPTRTRAQVKRAVSNDEVRGARSRRARNGADPFSTGAKSAAVEGATASRPAAVAWQPEGVPKRPPAKEDSDEDAFERFLNSRSDDFDLR
ncbi:MAG TPA: hypothetical protein VF168_13210 [Trueperaceae bacterium]